MNYDDEVWTSAIQRLRDSGELRWSEMIAVIGWVGMLLEERRDMA